MHIHFHSNRGRKECKRRGGGGDSTWDTDAAAPQASQQYIPLHRFLCCGMDRKHPPVDSLKLKPVKVEWLEIGAAVRCWRPSKIRFETQRKGSEGAWSSPDVPETREREMGVTAAFKVITEMKPERAAAAVVLSLDPWNERRLVGLCRHKASGLLSER